MSKGEREAMKDFKKLQDNQQKELQDILKRISKMGLPYSVNYRNKKIVAFQMNCVQTLIISGDLKMKIYVASSWRNLLHPSIVHALRRCGHEVYDFRNPKKGDHEFTWQEVGCPGYKHGDKVSAEMYRKMLEHPRAAEGYESDISHVKWCDVVVYVLPCGRSASFEFGYAMGQGKKGYVVAFEDIEPDLMFREATILGSMNDLFDAFGEPVEK